MYFPWVGLLEQVKLADVFVHYDDVQFARGFYNRVQVKTELGTPWITVPLRDHHRGQKIDEIMVDDQSNWRRRHRDVLHQAFRSAPFRDEALTLVEEVLGRPLKVLAEVSRASLLALAEYFGLTSNREFLDSRNLGVLGSGSHRLLDIVRAVGGNTYITGHGARNYLDHGSFERAGISVMYMDYRCTPYPQLYGTFTPYVTSLDLVANCGKAGTSFITSPAIDWRQFLGKSVDGS